MNLAKFEFELADSLMDLNILFRQNKELFKRLLELPMAYEDAFGENPTTPALINCNQRLLKLIYILTTNEKECDAYMEYNLHQREIPE